jgi:outer membrane protein assembly factor BamB
MMNRLAIACLCLVVANNLQAEDWPQWRGPRLDGSSTEKGLPLKWTATDNVAWTTPLPGIGHSSPIVVGDRVFVTTCLVEQKSVDKSRLLICIDRRDGKVLWQREVVTSPLETKHGLNSYSSSTPASDGRLVFVTFLRSRPMTEEDATVDPKIRDGHVSWKTLVPEMVVAAYDLDGNKTWEKVPGRFYSRHGFCSSPILHKNLVIINADQDATAYIVALDRSTGAEAWRINRPNRMRSYCVPLIVEAGGKTQMVLTGSEGADSFDPDTGKPIWHQDGPTEQYVASPVYGSGLLFMTAGFPTYHNWTVRPDGVGNITKSHVVWHENKTSALKASYVPSPLAVGDLFYMISDSGNLSCFAGKSGKRLFMEKLGDHHSGSPILAAGHVYLTDDAGITYVLKAGPTFELISQNPLGDKCFSSPAASRGQLFIRTNHALVSVGKK